VSPLCTAFYGSCRLSPALRGFSGTIRLSHHLLHLSPVMHLSRICHALSLFRLRFRSRFRSFLSLLH
jgi:hypothetical protein